MFLFNIGLSRLIDKFSLISNKYLLVPWARMVKSSKRGHDYKTEGGHILNSRRTA